MGNQRNGGPISDESEEKFLTNSSMWSMLLLLLSHVVIVIMYGKILDSKIVNSCWRNDEMIIKMVNESFVNRYLNKIVIKNVLYLSKLLLDNI